MSSGTTDLNALITDTVERLLLVQKDFGEEPTVMQPGFRQVLSRAKRRLPGTDDARDFYTRLEAKLPGWKFEYDAADASNVIRINLPAAVVPEVPVPPPPEAPGAVNGAAPGLVPVPAPVSVQPPAMANPAVVTPTVTMATDTIPPKPAVSKAVVAEPVSTAPAAMPKVVETAPPAPVIAPAAKAAEVPIAPPPAKAAPAAPPPPAEKPMTQTSPPPAKAAEVIVPPPAPVAAPRAKPDTAPAAKPIVPEKPKPVEVAAAAPLSAELRKQLLAEFQIERADPARAVELSLILAGFALHLDRILWDAWFRIAPDQRQARPAMRQMLGRYLGGAKEMDGARLRQIVDDLDRLTVALTAAISQAGSQFAQLHQRTFNPDMIKAAAEAESGGSPAQCWNKYVQLANDLDEQRIDEEILGTVKSFVLEVLRERK